MRSYIPGGPSPPEARNPLNQYISRENPRDALQKNNQTELKDNVSSRASQITRR
jgi:hypothetical protein